MCKQWPFVTDKQCLWCWLFTPRSFYGSQGILKSVSTWICLAGVYGETNKRQLKIFNMITEWLDFVSQCICSTILTLLYFAILWVGLWCWVLSFSSTVLKNLTFVYPLALWFFPALINNWHALLSDMCLFSPTLYNHSLCSFPVYFRLNLRAQSDFSQFNSIYDSIIFIYFSKRKKYFFNS